jgi:cyclopropane-fatty-acyl-phospholipid synthase
VNRSVARIAHPHPTAFAHRTNRALSRAQRIISDLFGPPSQRNFAVRYWTGMTEVPDHGSRQHFTLVLPRPDALRRMLLPPSELALAEAFVTGDFDIEGDAEAAASLATALGARLGSPRRLLRLVVELLRLPAAPAERDMAARRSAARHRAEHRDTRERDKAAIRHHYDVGNEFYALWLDTEQVYSCGYFLTGTENIDTAQLAKLDLICRKLRLAPGERLLDIGCGWGGLIRHAVRHYGVEALGITLSEAQAAYARERIADEGLADRCRIEIAHYRDLPIDRVFDKVASVGMFEHVGRRRLPEYFQIAFQLTKPGGLFLNHGIVSLDDARSQGLRARLVDRLWRRGEFMDRYVFPDGKLVPLASVLAAAERAGYETRDVESLRDHYVLTLRHWVQRLEARAGEAVAAAGEIAYRVWRLYMAASAHAFASARIGVGQVLFAKPDHDGRCCLPRARHDLYTATTLSAQGAHPL